MSTPGTQPQQAGWYPDPAGTGGQRWHDGQGWTGQVTYGKPQARQLGPGFARLADVLGWGLVISGTGYGLGALALAWLAMNPPDLLTTPATTGLPAQETTGGGGEGLLVLLYLGFSLVTLATQIVWLVWQYQVAVSAPAKLKRSPGMHVVWWFVPLANLVLPRADIGDLWHAYSTRRTGDPAEPTPVSFSVWWALWLSPMILMPMSIVALFNAATPEGAVSGVLWGLSLALFGTAGAGFAARTVVRSLSWRALLYYADAR